MPWSFKEEIDGAVEGNVIRNQESVIEAFKDILLLAKTNIIHTTEANAYSTFQFVARNLTKMMNSSK